LQTTKKKGKTNLYTGLFIIHQNKHLVTRWFTQFNIVCLWGVFSFVCLCSTSSNSSTFLASEADFKTAVIFIWAKLQVSFVLKSEREREKCECPPAGVYISPFSLERNQAKERRDRCHSYLVASLSRRKKNVPGRLM
jgi:hypothetical protein